MKNFVRNSLFFSLLVTQIIIPLDAETKDTDKKQSVVEPKDVALAGMSVDALKNIVKDVIKETMGYIDPFIILEQSDEYKDELKNIEKELEGRKQQLKSLEEAAMKKKTEIETMGNALNETAKDRKREEFGQIEAQYRIKLQSAQEYAEKADQQARMKVLKKIQEEAMSLAKEENRILVLAGGVIYGEQPVDLTQKVLTRLNANYSAEKSKKAVSDKKIKEEKKPEKTK
jgi:outer membrane protein